MSKKESLGDLQSLAANIAASRPDLNHLAERMREICRSVAGKKGQLILLIGTKTEMIQPPSCSTGGGYDVDTCFGLGILSSDDPTEIRLSGTGSIVFPTGGKSCVIHLSEDRGLVSRSDIRMPPLNDDLTSDFAYRIIVPVLQINELIDVQPPTRRCLEVFCGNDAVEALFELDGDWSHYREQFEYLCQMLGYETSAARRAKQDAHNATLHKLAVRRQQVISEARAVYLEAQKLGVADHPDYRVLREALRLFTADGDIDAE